MDIDLSTLSPRRAHGPLLPCQPRRWHAQSTVIDIEATGPFVVNIVSEDLAPSMVRTAATLPPETDETREAGISRIPSTVVKAPRVKHAKAAFECVLDRIVTFGAGAGNLILGTFKLMHVSDDVLASGPVVDRQRLCVLGRWSRTKYCAVRFALDIRPQENGTG
ncbi:MAG: flavin reductase family protein [Planctomycetota bacterium]|jgi:flavin reductase (DIM6/NTAB) family NADH-FMN oxidoreductase RutF